MRAEASYYPNWKFDTKNWSVYRPFRPRIPIKVLISKISHFLIWCFIQN